MDGEERADEVLVPDGSAREAAEHPNRQKVIGILDALLEILEVDPICECGEPGYACRCCQECGHTNPRRGCWCEEDESE